MRVFPIGAGFAKEHAVELLRRIDSGEAALYEGMQSAGSSDGVLFEEAFEHEGSFGVFVSYPYGGRLRVGIAFEEDAPPEAIAAVSQLLARSLWALRGVDASVWCRNENPALISGLRENFAFEPEAYGSHELMMLRGSFSALGLPTALGARPYESKHLGDYLGLLDLAMAHVSGPCAYSSRPDDLSRQFEASSEAGEFAAYWLDASLVGVSWRKGNEVDHLAVHPRHQGKGHGASMLRSVLTTILLEQSHDFAYLYCVDKNANALRFYVREGMVVSGHSMCLTLRSESDGLRA